MVRPHRFFIAVTLPFQWHTIVLWSCFFCGLALIQGVSARYILKSFGFAFLLSISIWLLNVFFHVDSISQEQAMVVANQNATKIWSMTWVAFISSKMINLRDVICFALQRRWLSSQIAYAMLVGIGSIGLMRVEARRIHLNAKLRGIKRLKRFSQWVPLLIFALRHAQRGAMSLRARGLTKHKHFYYDYQSSRRQTMRALIAAMIFAGIALTSEWLIQ